MHSLGLVRCVAANCTSGHPPRLLLGSGCWTFPPRTRIPVPPNVNITNCVLYSRAGIQALGSAYPPHTPQMGAGGPCIADHRQSLPATLPLHVNPQNSLVLFSTRSHHPPLHVCISLGLPLNRLQGALHGLLESPRPSSFGKYGPQSA
jgi:hypothetical protein